jgi:hypothetical protein
MRRLGNPFEPPSRARRPRQRPTRERPRRTTRPGPRTLVDQLPADVEACDFLALSRIAQGSGTSVSRPHQPPFVAGNDASLLGERAVMRGRSDNGRWPYAPRCELSVRALG